MATVRLFAAAAEAAGVDETQVSAGTVGAVRGRLQEDFGADFARVLRQCSIMVAGARADDSVVLTDHATVDVLPPFAGG